MKFNDKLHGDLFDLFLIYTFFPNRVSIAEKSSDLTWIKRTCWFKALRELIASENHPEEYECYLSDLMLRLVKQSPKGSKIFKHKIKITVTGEE